MNLSNPSGTHSGDNFSYAYNHFGVLLSHTYFTASDRLERGVQRCEEGGEVRAEGLFCERKQLGTNGWRNLSSVHTVGTQNILGCCSSLNQVFLVGPLAKREMLSPKCNP